MNTQGYKKAFCLEVHASTNVAAKGPLLLKLEQMDFYEFQTDEIRTGGFLFYLLFHEWQQQTSMGWTQISWQCWWPPVMAVWYHMMKTLPNRLASYMLRSTTCVCICIHTLNTIGLSQYYCVLLEKVSHPLGSPPTAKQFITHFVSRFNQ